MHEDSKPFARVRRLHVNPTTLMTTTIGLLSRATLPDRSSSPPARAIPAQQPARSEFIVKKGKDTVAVEIFSREASTLTSEIYQSNGIRTQYTLNLRPDSLGAARRDVATGTAGRRSRQFPFTSPTRSSRRRCRRGGESEKFEFRSTGTATPFLAVSFALAEQVVLASHLSVRKAVECGRPVGSPRATPRRSPSPAFMPTRCCWRCRTSSSRSRCRRKARSVAAAISDQDWLVERKVLK